MGISLLSREHSLDRRERGLLSACCHASIALAQSGTEGGGEGDGSCRLYNSSEGRLNGIDPSPWCATVLISLRPRASDVLSVSTSFRVPRDSIVQHAPPFENLVHFPQPVSFTVGEANKH
ncbi:unnamed protein product [Ectocarpus sp. 12 AP-2014]